jgi:hypothetical protein
MAQRDRFLLSRCISESLRQNPMNWTKFLNTEGHLKFCVSLWVAHHHPTVGLSTHGEIPHSLNKRIEELNKTSKIADWARFREAPRSGSNPQWKECHRTSRRERGWDGTAKEMSRAPSWYFRGETIPGRSPPRPHLQRAQRLHNPRDLHQPIQ